MNLTNYHYKTTIPVRFADLNAFGLVNNDVFLTYFEIAQSGYWKNITRWESSTHGVIISKAEIEYLHPLRFNNELSAHVRISSIQNTSFIMEYILTVMEPTGEKLCARGSTRCVFYDFQHAKPVAFPADLRERIVTFEGL